MSDKKCCVPGCAFRKGLVVLHRFPNPEKDRERFNIWLLTVGGDIIGLQNDHIYKYRRVCRIHFEVRFLCRNNRLSNIAVPTLHLPEPAAPACIPMEVEQVQVLPSCSSSQFPVTVEQEQVLPASSESQGINKTARQHLEPAAPASIPMEVEQVQVLPSCSSSQFPVTVEKEQVLPAISESQGINKTARRHLEPAAPASIPMEVEQVQVLPSKSSSESQGINKTARQHLADNAAVKDILAKVTEALDTTLTEMHQSLREKLIHNYLENQRCFKAFKQDVCRRLDEMDKMLMKGANQVLREDAEKKALMVRLLQEDIQASIDFIDKTDK